MPPWLQIEVAYDILLMESMKRRLTGEADVARSVRFADVPQPKKKQVDVYTAFAQCSGADALWMWHLPTRAAGRVDKLAAGVGMVLQASCRFRACVLAHITDGHGM